MADTLGALQPSQLRPEFQQAIRELKPGQFTDVIQIPSGFAILTTFASAPRTQDLDAEHLKSLVSRGAVRDTIDISGITSANAAFQAYPKPAGWDRDLSQVCAIRTNSYSAVVERLGRQLPEADAQPAGKIAPLSLLQGHAVLALLFVYSGEMEKSIAEWNKSYQIALASVPGSVPYVEEALGVTHLHLAEDGERRLSQPGKRWAFSRPLILVSISKIRDAFPARTAVFHQVS